MKITLFDKLIFITHTLKLYIVFFYSLFYSDVNRSQVLSDQLSLSVDDGDCINVVWCCICVFDCNLDCFKGSETEVLLDILFIGKKCILIIKRF